ncbi:30S ribosomal protein S19 [Candidatus Pacearchaeota archaeon]|nr:30S ribosomal protein S19 [Candidatus Pacearchaeota archaeon]
MVDNKPIIKKKEFKYRGKTLEELKELDIREFSRLVRANERRTLLRQSDEVQKFVIKCNNKSSKDKQIRTHSRYLIIVPKMVGFTIHVYSGKAFVPVQIIGEMLGHRLGEFSVTRTKVKHGAAGVGATRSSSSMSVK